MRLNLGCGGRVFKDDWINVDIFDTGPSDVAYVKADISKRLPFEDNSADEVFSCHVVEHLWPWDVETILADWIRVVRPGGKLVIECPNLMGAAAILQAAETLDNRDLYRNALFALYGDPGEKFHNIEQRHKWGYTPKSLGALLVGLGLKNVRQVPAQFKMKEPRDMRIEGMKL